MSDIVIVSTAAPDYIMKKADLAAELKRYPRGIRLFIDLSVPRNIEPEINDIDGIVLYTIDDLRRVAEKNAVRRGGEVTKVLGYIGEGLDDFRIWYSKRKLVPVFDNLRRHHTEVKNSVLKAYTQQLAGMDEKERETLTRILDTVIDRLVNEPLMNLEKDGDPSNLSSLPEALARMYRLR